MANQAQHCPLRVLALTHCQSANDSWRINSLLQSGSHLRYHVWK